MKSLRRGCSRLADPEVKEGDKLPQEPVPRVLNLRAIEDKVEGTGRSKMLCVSHSSQGIPIDTQVSGKPGHSDSRLGVWVAPFI
jgi:hypothetical protein